MAATSAALAAPHPRPPPEGEAAGDATGHRGDLTVGGYLLEQLVEIAATGTLGGDLDTLTAGRPPVAPVGAVIGELDDQHGPATVLEQCRRLGESLRATTR
ncbi:hypothetical protein ACFPM0_02440 [Pseudonocardia sulfidoxydans]|uniref:hypothetical protein n=1 Tax=Pseudonocardia sulfidoxydans TaxID=54011 RepID=UPI00361887F1